MMIGIEDYIREAEGQGNSRVSSAELNQSSLGKVCKVQPIIRLGKGPTPDSRTAFKVIFMALHETKITDEHKAACQQNTEQRSLEVEEEDPIPNIPQTF